MKNLIYLSLFFPIFIYAQQESITNRHHIQKEGESFYFFVTDKEPNFDNSKFYFWYRAQRIRETQGGASGELLHGKFEVYFENKQLKEKGEFKKGLKNGNWKSWFKDGSLKSTTNWSKGRLKAVNLFADNGELKSKTKYGTFRNSFTSETKEIFYSKDSLNVKVINYSLNGEKLSVVKTKLGKLHGVQKTYTSKKGVLKKKYKNGELIPEKLKKNKEDKTKKDSKKKEVKVKKSKSSSTKKNE